MPEILTFLREATGENIVRLETPSPAASATAGDLRAQFEAAVERVRTAPADGPLKPSNEMKLKMYGLYRQAQNGDVSGKRPGMMDVVGRFKYDAWAALKGMAPEAAMRQYIQEVESIEKKFASMAQHG
jgi:diazepam-binding inhibitor (GABA receptor modulating acyl-CoA-binding protein)